MRRISKRSFTWCAVLLAVSWIAVTALWIRSHWVHDQLVWQRSGNTLNIGSTRGGIWFTRFSGLAGGGPPTGYRSVRPPAPDPTTNLWRLAGFHYWRGPLSPGLSMTIFRVPMWAVLVGHLLFAIAFFRLFGPTHPAELRICRTCGYDLRASQDRCPECGTALAENRMTAQC